MTWVKGQSGNPAGPPRKGESVAEEIKRLLRTVEPGTKKKRSELVAAKVIEMAIGGNIAALDRVLDRTEGKVPDQSIMAGVIEYVYGERLGPAGPAREDHDPAPASITSNGHTPE